MLKGGIMNVDRHVRKMGHQVGPGAMLAGMASDRGRCGLAEPDGVPGTFDRDIDPVAEPKAVDGCLGWAMDWD